MNKTISAYTTTYNCIDMHYPFKECIQSLLRFSDEVIVVDAGSTDGTLQELERMRSNEPKLKVWVEPVDFSHPRWAIMQDGLLKAKARARCTCDYCWQSDSDEIVSEEDVWKIRQLPQAMGDIKLIMLPMIEFWGDLDTVRGDFFSWKPRFSVNDKRITHGIPTRYKCYDQAGNAYPRPFDSDTCNYIYAETGEDVKIVIPINADLAEVNRLSNDKFVEFFYKSIDELPSVYHVSWLDLRRKIAHYKKFWKKFHASMYNLEIADTAQNNVMFDKPWSEVNDRDIELKADELKRIGPRSFHNKIDPNLKGFTFHFNRRVPENLRLWAQQDHFYTANSSNNTQTASTHGATQIKQVQQDLQAFPLVSAIIPTYNKAAYLRESVGSMLAQDYPNIEIIIVNDGSTDDSSAVARALISENPSKNIKLVEKSNGGISDARNFGINNALGNYIATLDGDDLAESSFISKGMKEILSGNCNLFCSDVELFGVKSGEWRPNPYNDYYIRYSNSIPSLALYVKDLWIKAGGYKVALAFVEDWDFWVSCSRFGLRVIKSHEKLFKYRMTNSGLADAHINNRHNDCQSIVTVSNEDLYSVEEVIRAHSLLVQVPAATVAKVSQLDRIHPKEWILKFWLGLLAEERRDFATALNFYIEAINLTNQKNWQPILKAALIIYKEQRSREALELLNYVRTIRPDCKRFVNDPIRELETQIIGSAQTNLEPVVAQ